MWAANVAPALDDYIGRYVFERMVADAYHQLHSRLQLAGAAELARWEGRDRNRRSIEIDVVARLDDGRILTGVVKWSRGHVDSDVHYGLVRSLEDLGASGQGWARDALDPDAGAGHLYVSAAGFTDHLRELAERDRRIHLLDLDDLYA